MRPPGQKLTKLGAVFSKNSFDPMFWVTKKNFTKNFHTNFHINGSFWGGMVTLRELRLNAEIEVVPRNGQINRGMGKFYNETPLIDDQRLIIYIAAVCIVTSRRYCSPQICYKNILIATAINQTFSIQCNIRPTFRWKRKIVQPSRHSLLSELKHSLPYHSG